MKPDFYHTGLSDGKWQELSFAVQMANIGSEIERTIKWKNKNRNERSQLAFFRALELIDFTIADEKNIGRLGELCRVREVLVDYFAYNNQYQSTDEAWQKYFRAFNWMVNREL